MALPPKTKKYLDAKLAKYDAITHKTVYTAYDAAQTLQQELRHIAKSLLIAVDRAYVIAVVPAHMRLDLNKLKKSIGAKKISIPKEQIMVKVFKVKPGAMTAFGGLHKVEVWADKSLLKTKELVFAAGNFTDSVRMKVKDFLQLEQASLANFATSAGYKIIKKVGKKITKKTVVKKKAGIKRPAIRGMSKRSKR